MVALMAYILVRVQEGRAVPLQGGKMDELLKVFLEETEAEERSYWYTHGYDAEVAALNALAKVIIRVQHRLGTEI